MQIAFIYASVILLSVTISHLEAIRCYICGIGADEPFKNTKDVGDNSKIPNSSGLERNNSEIKDFRRFPSSCQEFNEKISTSLDEFSAECPSDYNGCTAEINKNGTIRTCETLPINDCKTMNGVKYCYCSTNLCNGEELMYTMGTMPKHGKGSIEEEVRFIDRNTDDDDEDLAESSGMNVKNLNRKGITNRRDSTAHNNSKIPQANIDLILFIVFYYFFSAFHF